MTNFYSHLKQSTTKASAFQQAQRGLIRGEMEVNNDNIRIDTVNIPTASLPPKMRENLRTKNLSHPYYWSAFTLIGNPW
jgi:CHAT domain-containing protein